MKMLSVILLLTISANIPSEAEEAVYKLGGIFFEDDDAKDMREAFELSARLYNFSPAVLTVSRGETLAVSQKICELAAEEGGIVSVVDGTGGRASEHVQAACDVLEIPHVAVHHNDYCNANWSLLNLYPSSEAYNMALEKLILHKDWTNYTILYVEGHSLSRLYNLLKMGNDTDRSTVMVRELSGDDYRDVLIDAKHSGYTNFVVDCPSQNLEQFLNQSQEVGLMADEHSYIFLSPDLFTLDLSRFRYGGVNMTGFRLWDLKDNENIWSYTAEINKERQEPLEPEQVKTEVVLIHDAVKVIASALTKVNVTPTELQCDNFQEWVYGSSLLNFMKTNKINGITRKLAFDGIGQRTDVTLEILESTAAGNQTIGFWKNGGLFINRPIIPSAEITGESIMKNKTFKVLIALTEPYGFAKESTVELEGNDRYEGFTIDLFGMIADMLGFSFELEVEPVYGSFNKTTGKSTGMVHKIREERADFGICDFTITAERQSAIDFSVPFITTGIGIIYKEPSKQPPEMFSFMAVFSDEVWMYIVFVQLGLGIIMIFVGRISHKEWQNPVPCIEQPEEFTNQFSFANSVWLIIGSVMQQGSEIAPIAIAPRMITSVWWFFTMVIVASYTGTLVAFLTVEKNVMPFNNVDDLYKQKSIMYGAKKGGATLMFFKLSKKETYKKMYEKMEANNWNVMENYIGVNLADNSTYAFFMEGASIEYYKERHCDLLQIGGLLDTKSYGIGMKTGSEYKKYIDDALLKLKERGEIQKLKDLWWKEKRGGGKCGEKRSEEQKQLGMKNMIGAFVVLGVGCLIGLVISTLDMLWGVFKKSVKYNRGLQKDICLRQKEKTKFQYELVEELKFALKFSGDVKPVKRPRPTAGSAEKLAEVDLEAKDELRSLRSVRSSDTHRTHHSHGSKHSSRSQSVAFARMREYD